MCVCLCVCVCVFVFTVTCSAINVFSSLSETKPAVRSLDILHVLITSFASINLIICKLPCLNDNSQLTIS